MPKKFTVAKGEKGLLMIADASGNPRQAVAYTREGDTLRFSLEGDGGAFYTVKEGQEEFEELAKAFEEAGVSADAEEEKPVPKKAPERVAQAASAA